MIVILGNGGHANVCIEVLRLTRPPFSWRAGPFDLGGLPNDGTEYIIGVGDLSVRRKLFEHYGEMVGPVVHPSVVAPDWETTGIGIQAMAGAIIQPGCTIGNNVLINTRASIDHDCIIGDHVHIAPGAILCGGVTVGEGAFIGAGAVITEGKTVPPGAFVRAGTMNDLKWRTPIEYA